MDSTYLVNSAPPVSEATRSSTGWGTEQTVPTAPPALVDKFEALMARTSAGPSHTLAVPPAVVSGVESHIDQYTQVFDQMSSIDPRTMNLGDITLVGMRMTVQMGMLSMQHTAYTQALNSSKGAVGSLMKNQ